MRNHPIVDGLYRPCMVYIVVGYGIHIYIYIYMYIYLRQQDMLVDVVDICVCKIVDIQIGYICIDIFINMYLD